ncbi:hypothetical protein CQA53_09255 [Helicobacter didelphidarum]|uniref:Outer membrane protein beta-barrel domain-containing protein n=1 Tax=Helicobacter didelphidarum TaxID=2040648 RepID=A0A3D8IBF9_9HELI|nr:hypothetical protein [Helicobacter didelphidarum]RDU62472.1 hypothetical protein CQA53_09255 [Helicobacter didelphidarum]
MRNTKLFKKTFIALSLASVFGVSANAFCDSKGTTCFIPTVGIGGIYSDFGGGSNAGVANYGGYLTADWTVTWKERILGSLGATLGGGVSNLSGVNLAALKQTNPFIISNIEAKVGFNISTKEVPIYINIFTRNDGLFNKAIMRNLGLVGVELQAKIPVSSNVKILFGGGYSGVYGYYQFGGLDSKSSLNGYNYGIHANIGFTTKITQDYSYYLKVVGQYYNLNDSKAVTLNNQPINYPGANSFNVMLEMGVKGI